MFFFFFFVVKQAKRDLEGKKKSVRRSIHLDGDMCMESETIFIFVPSKTFAG